MAAETNTRGEVSLELGGTKLGLRPTFDAIEAFETATDRSLLQLARIAIRGEMKLGELSQVVEACAKAWGVAKGDELAQQVNARKIARLIVESDGGVAGALTLVAAMLSIAATGGYTAEGEAKAGTEMTAPTPAAA